jgi:hypothetical protein
MKWNQEMLAMLRYNWRCRPMRLSAYAALATLISSLLIALAWWMPAQREAAALQAEIEARRTAMVESVRMEQMIALQRDALRNVTLLEKKLRATAGQADMVQEVARLANRHGVRVLSQSFDEGKGQHDGALYLELGLSGPYAALRAMIGDFTALPTWVEVVDAHFERGASGAAPVRVQLRLLTYRGERGQS